MGNYVLLTGATGLLGQYLLRDLLCLPQAVCVVARGDDDEHVRRRIESILQRSERTLGRTLPRPICFAGDIGLENLGLDKNRIDWVTSNCCSVIHNAASISFDRDTDGEPEKTNVGGTRNLLQLCRSTNVRNLHYVSTAYVCGSRQQRILEKDLDFGQSFRNAYEKSKFEAEKLIRASGLLDQLTIYRPSAIAGDSETGFTSTYHGIYQYLKLISVLVRNTKPDDQGIRHTPIRLNMRGDEQRNIIPVDWVSKVICHLFSEPESHGRTFHLTPEVPLLPRQIIEAGYNYFNSTGVEFCGPNPEQAGSENEFERNWYANMTAYQDYEHSDPEFATDNLQQFASHLPCPPIDEQMLHRFWRYGEADNWGKRGLTPGIEGFPVASHLAKQILESDSQNGLSPAPVNGSNRRGAHQVSLDLLGPGGGQWELHIKENRLVDFEPGIGGPHSSTIQLTTDKFAALVQGESEPQQALDERHSEDDFLALNVLVKALAKP